MKSRLLGRPLASSEADHQLLPKTLALPVFASDPLSSVAYATEEAMLVLALAGVGAFVYLTPVSFAVAGLLAIVVISYRQTIRAYPEGGGAFGVSYENLGVVPGAVAASSLLVDYVLTVAVSVSAGVAAITSAVPELLPWRVTLALVFVALVTIANLRGVKEASTLFAAPTYLFITTVFTVLIVGFLRCADGVCPQAISSGLELEAEVGAVTLFLLLRAFASGSTALTGVEAVADGVQAFRNPKARNAAATLGVMGDGVDRHVPRDLRPRPTVRRPGQRNHDRHLRHRAVADWSDGVQRRGGFLGAPGGYGGDPDPRRQHRIPGLPPAVGDSRQPSDDAPPVPQPR